MNKDLKLLAAFFAIPALLLMCAGVWLLTHVAREVESNREAFENLRNERWKALMHDVEGRIRPKSAADRERELQQILEDEPYAQGAFIWRKGKGLICSLNIPPDLEVQFPSDYTWKAKGRTPDNRNLQKFGEHLVAWQRIQKNDAKRLKTEVVGVLVGNPERLPFDDPAVINWTGGSLVGLAVFLVCLGLGVLVHAAHKARQDALTKTNFVSLVSHELNTPLTAIIPYANMLRKGQITTEEERQEAYDVIADESVRLKGLVAELLDFSRLERRTKKFTLKDFDVSELVQTVVRLMRGRFPEGAPTVSGEASLSVHADADAVKAILVNLLDNAAKYAPGAPVEVVAEKGVEGMRVEVRDRGPGLSPEGLRNVFTRFWRADDSTTASVGGFGLGLTIARSYAREMGGDLTCAAREGGGTVFTLELKEAGNG